MNQRLLFFRKNTESSDTELKEYLRTYHNEKQFNWDRADCSSEQLMHSRGRN